MWYYSSETNVEKFLGNVKQISAATDAFAEVEKVTNHTELWDDKLAWYSPRAIHRIFLYGLEHSLGIHGFRPDYIACVTAIGHGKVKMQESKDYYEDRK